MLKNIISFFRSNVTIFAFNIIGLTVAFMSVIVIATYVVKEFSYDTFHKDSDRLYRIEIKDDDWDWAVSMPKPMTDQIFQYSNYIEQFIIEDSWKQGESIVNILTDKGDAEFYNIEKTAVSPNFLTDYLNLEIIDGDVNSINNQNKVVISSSLSKRLFLENPVGKSIQVGKGTIKANYTIGAVFKDLPDNTIFKYDLYEKISDESKNFNWGNWAIKVYIKLKPDVSAEQFESVLNENFIETAKKTKSESLKFKLTKVSDIYFTQGIDGDSETKGNKIVNIALIIVAIMLLLISIVNFINFYLSIAGYRAKAISIHRIMGQSALRAKNVVIFECIIIYFASYALAIISIFVLNDNNLTDISLLENIDILCYLFIMIIAIGAIIGIGYSKYLVAKEASFSMLISKSKHKGVLNCLLIGLQFFISFIFVIVSVYMIMQMRFINNRDLGFAKERIITFEITNNLARKYMIVRDELLNKTDIQDVAFSDDKFANVESKMGQYYKEKYIEFDFIGVSYNFLDVMNIKMLNGRNFANSDYLVSSENNMTLIFNKVAQGEFGIVVDSYVKNSVNSGNIVGVCDDINASSLKHSIEPFAFVLFPEGREWSALANVYCKVNSDNIDSIMAQIKTVMEKLDPSYPIEFSIFENDIKQVYKNESDATFNMILFAIISIIISLMGVMGLLMYEVKSRQREIAVRKVYGSSEMQILQLFNRRIFKIAFVGYILAVPVCYFAIEKWQQQFAYVIDSSIFIYIASLIFILTLTFVIVTSICWKYSRQNPTKTLNK